MMAKRIFDLVFAGGGLVALAPLFAVIAVWIRLDSRGPVFFRQERVGQHGRLFRIHKFRTMVVSPGQPGPSLTVGEDPRITASGRFLRRSKLDELPQLIDVVRGEMSLVGARPEVPRYAAFYPEEARRRILALKPGITDPASILFRKESELMAAAADPEVEYVQQILPVKIRHYLQYVESRSLWMDVKLILKTLRTLTR